MTAVYGEHIADKMMGRALALSAERSDLDSLITSEALLVGGIAPTEIVADMRLRARELDFIADVHEIRHGPLSGKEGRESAYCGL